MEITVNMPIESQTLMRNILDTDRERLEHAAVQFIAAQSNSPARRRAIPASPH
jgi:hypothetical protein